MDGNHQLDLRATSAESTVELALCNMPEEEAPKSKSESNPPPGTTKAFVMKVKSAATLITSIAALVIAIGKACQAPDEPGAKAAYSELSAAVKANSEALGRTHDDVVALRGYVDGFTKAPMITVATSSDAGTDAKTDAGSYRYIYVPAPTTSAPLTSASSVSVSAFAALAPPDHPKPLPPVNDRPPVFRPQGFEKLQAKKDSKE